ncbi:MAG: hypothetical protein U0271_20905 [Polyangiaceae bacterium]
MVSLASSPRALATSILISTWVLVSCSDDTSRRGGLGDSCQKTDDCESPLVCRELVCVDPNSPTTTSSTGGTTNVGGMGGAGGLGNTTSSTGGGDAGGTGGSGLSWEGCDTCLDDVCAAEQAACDGACLAIEACIETQCAHLGSIGSSDEGPCFVNCQDAHPGGKQKHLDVVNCAISAWNGSCTACSSYPYDFEQCRAFMLGGACQSAFDACAGSSDCQTFKDCTSTCTTLAACLACDDTPAGAAGRQLYEAVELCVAGECLAESWLP